MFRLNQLLSDCPECGLELRCPGCQSIVVYPTRLLIERRGIQNFSTLLRRLCCKRCQTEPVPVDLCAGHRERCGGSDPDWR